MHSERSKTYISIILAWIVARYYRLACITMPFIFNYIARLLSANSVFKLRSAV
jgi:hypothetical protein